MKAALTVLLFAAVMFITSPADAAESALDLGSVSLGGGFSFQNARIEGADDNINTILLAPSAMVYLFRGFAVGVELSFLHMSEGDYSAASHRYLGKVQYVFPLESKVKPFIYGGFGFIRVSEGNGYYYSPELDEYYEVAHHSENGWTMKGGFGFYTFLNEHFALRASGDFIHDTLMISAGNNPTTDTLMFSVGFEGFIF